MRVIVNGNEVAENALYPFNSLTWAVPAVVRYAAGIVADNSAACWAIGKTHVAPYEVSKRICVPPTPAVILVPVTTTLVSGLRAGTLIGEIVAIEGMRVVCGTSGARAAALLLRTAALLAVIVMAALMGRLRASPE